MRKWLLTFAILCAVPVSGRAQDAASPPVAPSQPIAFNHKQHADAKMSCNDCHASRGDGTTVTIPQAAKCMTCHASVAADKPEIQRLAAAAKNEETIAWVRVYRVPGFVTFSHKTHAGSACAECHGPVAERAAIALEKDTHMGTCIACHSAKQAPTGCDTCHAIQSKNGQAPFEVDGTVLARLRQAAGGEPLPFGVLMARQIQGVASFLHAPML